MKIDISRLALYERVWTTPMTRLSIEFGVKTPLLTAFVRNAGIPTPPAGYWTQVEHGTARPRPELGPAPSGVDDVLVLDPALLRSPQRLRTTSKVNTSSVPAAAVEADGDEQAASAPDDETSVGQREPPGGTPNRTEEPQRELTAYERAYVLASKWKVSDSLRRPHSIVAELLNRHAERRRSARGASTPSLRRHLDPGALTDIDDRRHRILDAFCKGVEGLGHSVRETERRDLIAKVDGEDIEFQVRQREKVIHRQPTPSDSSWQIKKNGLIRELVPTGRLVFEIKAYLDDGMRRTWEDSARGLIEASLTDILATFIVAGDYLVARRREREESERRYRAAQIERHLAQQRLKKEQNQRRYLGEMAKRWERSLLTRRFIEALKDLNSDFTGEVGGRTLTDWLAWAENAAAYDDPLHAGVESVFTEIGSVTDTTYRD